MQIYSLRNWPNRKVYSIFNDFFKYANILQVCAYNLINLWRKQWLSVEMGLGDKMLSRPKFSPFILHICYIKILNPSKAAWFLPSYPWLFCGVTESSNGTIFMEFLFWVVLLEILHIMETLHIIFWRYIFLKTLKHW